MSKAWFAPKRHGYGAGLPISWEGWLVLIGFFLATWALMFFARHIVPPEMSALVRIGGLGLLIALLVLIARAKTDGGWRWRNGKD